MIDINSWGEEAYNHCINTLEEKNMRTILEQYLWNIYESKDKRKAALEGLMQRYPNRMIYPILHRKDNDDIICATPPSNNSNEIPLLLIHDFTEEGCEVWGQWDSIIRWLDDTDSWQR